MYAVTGITGHVGGTAARILLAGGPRVRAVPRAIVEGEGMNGQTILILGASRGLGLARRGICRTDGSLVRG